MIGTPSRGHFLFWVLSIFVSVEQADHLNLSQHKPACFSYVGCVQALSSTLLGRTACQFSLEEDLKRWQEKQIGIRLSDKKEDCLTNLRFADDVLLFSTSLTKLEEMLCDFKRSTESVGLGIHPSKTKILSNQATVKKKEVTIDNIKIEVLQKRKCTISWSKNYIRRTRNGRNQEQTESGMGSIPQIPTGTYFKNISPMPKITLVQHGDHADNDLRKWNVNIVLGT